MITTSESQKVRKSESQQCYLHLVIFALSNKKKKQFKPNLYFVIHAFFRCKFFSTNLANDKYQVCAPAHKVKRLNFIRFHTFSQNYLLLITLTTSSYLQYKLCKNCKCCPVSLLIVRSQRLSRIQVPNCQNYYQCLKCHK